ncbi:hypothetical protein VP1G_01021 [Cytospora mali]|uniref:Uncharacterized protein n=1 Tax=Cytospora mali TaxID=578113 RepID=A0A194UPP7_CYTMA|nr:hypothetical protein VP1G_01021 [Valsa mali var. pyri (nom. inval.)]
MTTNSFGSPLPRFDYPSIQPVVNKTSRVYGLTPSARIISVAAAAGLVYFAGSQVQQRRELQVQRQPVEQTQRRPAVANVYTPWDMDRQPTVSRALNK